MPTTLKSVAMRYLVSMNVARGTRNEYDTTLRKWEKWGQGVSIEQLGRNEIREFLNWVFEQAVASEGENPGRTANKAREQMHAVMSWASENDSIDSMPRFPLPRLQRDVAGRHYLTKAEIITCRHYAHRAPLAFKAIMTLPQPTAFSALIQGYEGQCPCCRRKFTDGSS